MFNVINARHWGPRIRYRPAWLLILSPLSFATTVSAEIYKIVDTDGNIVFTDIPPNDSKETVQLTDPNDFTPIAPTTPDSTNTPNRALHTNTEGPTELLKRYESVVITQPAEDEAVRENSGNITVRVSANPTLSLPQGHIFELRLDTVVIARNQSGIFKLENVDRGTHTLKALIMNNAETVVATSADQTFHMLRYSALKRRRN